MLDPRADEQEIYNHGLTGISAVKAYLSSVGRRIDSLTTTEAIQGNLQAIAECWQARPINETIGLSGSIQRMIDPQWWSRNLRREMLRENENAERASGMVRRKSECYVSDFGLKKTLARAKLNKQTLERLEVINDDGEAFNLAEVADASVSNPKLRRTELMTRCRGFEEMAEMMGHTGFFLTITCPSRFHRFSGSLDNKKWAGSTTKDAQNYLCKTWAKIRAKWKKDGFEPYGFRVAEPHHEGCVHWHILLFAPAEQIGRFNPSVYELSQRKQGLYWACMTQKYKHDRGPMLPVFGPLLPVLPIDGYGGGIVGTAGSYAMQESPSEKGAVKHRFTCKMIDSSKGSATGYIAKYICKNIDGLKHDGDQVGLDYDSGKNAIVASARVRAWASIARIRQFQQIGGPSVTVWREMRRVKEDKENAIQLPLFEGARLAADEGNWMAFWSVQGGCLVSKSELALKPAYTSDSTGKYGDPVERVHGVNSKCGSFIKTRAHTWRIQRGGRGEVDRVDNLQRRIFKQYGTPMARALLGYEFGPELERKAPRTGVNNCTDSSQTEAEKLDFLRNSGSDFRGWRKNTTPESQKNEPDSNDCRQTERVSLSHPQ